MEREGGGLHRSAEIDVGFAAVDFGGVGAHREDGLGIVRMQRRDCVAVGGDQRREFARFEGRAIESVGAAAEAENVGEPVSVAVGDVEVDFVAALDVDCDECAPWLAGQAQRAVVRRGEGDAASPTDLGGDWPTALRQAAANTSGSTDAT